MPSPTPIIAYEIPKANTPTRISVENFADGGVTITIRPRSRTLIGAVLKPMLLVVPLVWVWMETTCGLAGIIAGEIRRAYGLRSTSEQTIAAILWLGVSCLFVLIACARTRYWMQSRSRPTIVGISPTAAYVEARGFFAERKVYASRRNFLGVEVIGNPPKGITLGFRGRRSCGICQDCTEAEILQVAAALKKSVTAAMKK